MEFFIYCYGDMETLRGLFEGIARITRIATPFGSQFSSIIKVIMLLGFFAMMVYGLATPGKFPVLSWFAGVLLVYGLLFLPTATVWFLDNTREGATAAGGSVDDVPFGLALLASLTSHIGHQLTTMFEDGMQSVSLPETLKYGKHGLVTGNRMVLHARKVEIKTPQLYMDMMNFLYNCTMYDIADGTIDANIIQTSTNIWDDIGPSETNPSRYTPVGSDGTVTGCRTAHTQISTVLTNEIPIARAGLMKKMNPDRTLAESEVYFDEQFRAAMQTARLGDASADVSTMLRQNMMVNIIAQSSGVIGQKMADPATVMYGSAVSQAAAATNMGYLVQGAMAAQAMPMIRNAIEAVAYALFPFVILICFVSSASGMLMALKSYIMTLVWVQLWPPIYAVLNYIATLTCGYNIGSAGGFASGEGGGFALANANTIYSASISNEAVVGYMTVLVPVIATAVVYGGSKAGSIGVQGMVASSSRASEGAASGNVNMGNVSLNQHNLAASRSDPMMSTQKNAFGETTSHIGQQGIRVSAYQEKMSSFATDVKLSQKDADNYQQKATRAQQQGTEFSKQASDSYASAVTKFMEYSKAHKVSGGSMSAEGSGRQAGEGGGTTEQIQNAEAFNKQLGLSKDSAVGHKWAAKAAAAGSLGVDFAGNSAKIMAEAGVEGSKLDQTKVADAIAKLDANTHSDTAAKMKNFMSTTMSMSMSTSSNSTDRQAADGIKADLKTSHDYTEAAAEKYSESKKQEHIANVISEASKNTTLNLANALMETGHIDSNAYERADAGERHRMVVNAAASAIENGELGMDGRLHPPGDNPPYGTPGSQVAGPSKEGFDKAEVGGGKSEIDAGYDAARGEVAARRKLGGVDVAADTGVKAGKGPKSAVQQKLDAAEQGYKDDFQAAGDKKAKATQGMEPTIRTAQDDAARYDPLSEDTEALRKEKAGKAEDAKKAREESMEGATGASGNNNSRSGGSGGAGGSGG